jgi:uncharacterized protein YydD (DUF2326 family)
MSMYRGIYTKSGRRKMAVEFKYRLPICPEILEFLEDAAELDDYTKLEHILERYEGQEIEELMVSENELTELEEWMDAVAESRREWLDDDVREGREGPAFEEYGIARYFLEAIKDVVDLQGFSDEVKKQGEWEGE